MIKFKKSNQKKRFTIHLKVLIILRIQNQHLQTLMIKESAQKAITLYVVISKVMKILDWKRNKMVLWDKKEQETNLMIAVKCAKMI